MKLYESNVIAIDFDGTIFPGAGTDFPVIHDPTETNLKVIETAIRVHKKGDLLILWTCRHGDDLFDAVKKCSEYGLFFDDINKNSFDEIRGSNCIEVPHSRKIYANLYVDDKSPGSIDYFINQYEIDKREFLKA